MTEKEYILDEAFSSLFGGISGLKTSADEDLMNKSIIKEGFSNLKQLPMRFKNKKRKKKPEVKADLPEEVETDLKILRMRDAIDPKRFYKRNATKGMKDVQVGTVLDSPADFYHSRLPMKQRKNTLVDQLLADAKFKKEIKRRYVKIIDEKQHKYRNRHRVLSNRNMRKNNEKRKNKK